MATIFNFPWLTEPLKKGMIKYLVGYYLGHFLSEELDLSQFDIELFNGTASIEDIFLNVNTINQLLSPYFPLKFLEGFVNKIDLSIPWKDILTESCSIQLHGIRLDFSKLSKCNEDEYNQNILSKSMMASSMEMAEEILQKESEKYEGLEKFAQLINSIIRRVKLSAKDTNIKFIFPYKIGEEIELRVKYINCEEEQITLDDNNKDNIKENNTEKNKNTDIILSDVITKRITLEGIELFINNILVTKLYGKNTFEIKFDGNKISMEAYFGSCIFAILNSSHIKILDLFFQIMDENSSFNNNDKPKECPMTKQDYRQVQEILNKETIPKQLNINSSMISKTWTDDSVHEDEFMSFIKNDEKKKCPIDSTNDTLFNCLIKIPGLILCIISDDDQMPQFNEMPRIDNLQTLIGINSFLNEMLNDYSHVRLFASSLCYEINGDQMKFSCTNISSYEYHQGIMNILLKVDDNKSDMITPSIKLKKCKKEIFLTVASTSIRIDPTMIERHPKIFELFIDSNDKMLPNNCPLPNSNDGEKEEMIFQINCVNVLIEFYFPIPDLRPERNDYSLLHEEVLLIDLKDIKIKLESTSGELSCSEMTLELKIDDECKKFFHAHSENTNNKCKNIELNFSKLIPFNMNESFDENGLFKNLNSLSESVNFLQASAIKTSKKNDPFQVKRNVFGDESYEQIITPGDRNHAEDFISYNRKFTKFYIDIQIPYGEAFLEDKTLFELIYNRFANDLILWKPFYKKNSFKDTNSMPKLILPILNEPLTGNDDSFYAENSIDEPKQVKFNQDSMFYTCHNNDFMSGSELSDNSYHSVMESSSVTLKPQNEFLIQLELENLNINFKAKPEQKHSIFMQNFLLGIIGGPESEQNTIICICSKNIAYKCNTKQMMINNSHSDVESELNLAMDIKRENKNLKKIKLAIQLKNSLLLGLDLPIFESLWEFVNVRDDDVLGYICPRVAIELHVDLMKSGILFDILKERTTLLHFEDVYLTSMVVENTNQTILRFFIEEALLCFKRNHQLDDNLKNFFSVIDSGVIDINLKISKDGKIEWNGSNNEINLKVCYDSLVALCQFLQAFAAMHTQQDQQNCADLSENSIADPTIMINDENDVEYKIQLDCDLIADALSECDLEEKYDGSNKNCACTNSQMDDSNFFILGESDIGSGIHTSEEPKIRVLTDEPIEIIENHFKFTHYNVVPEITASTIARFLLDRMSLKIYLYGGKDFDDDFSEQNKNSNNNNVETLSLKSEKSQRVRFIQNSILWENIDLMPNGYLMNNQTDTHFSLKSTGGTKRKLDTYIVLAMKRIKILFDKFDKNESLAWKFLFLVEDLEIIDKVSVSKINKMLYEYYSESDMPRRQYSHMFSIRLNSLRNFQDQKEEGVLTVSLKPLRINIDQDTLLFLMEFFTKFSETLTINTNVNTNMNYMKRFDSKTSINSGQSDELINKEEFSTDKHYEDDIDEADDNVSISSNETGKRSNSFNNERIRHDSINSNTSKTNIDAIFIKSFTFWPDVPIRLDYHGKHIDFKQGTLPGIALGLAQLNQSELYLKKLVNKHGLLGIDKVIQYAIDEWGKDIKRNQLPSILGGVGPMHSFILLFQGFRDLIWIPIDQYRRDQRIVRGIQRGAYAFSFSTAKATLELANRVVNLIQSTAQFAHDIVTPPNINNRNQMVPYSQPRDVREGLTVAYAHIREGFHETVRGMTNTNLVADDTVTVIGQVVRQIPSTVVRPVIHLTKATSSVLVGFRNQITPEARKDDQDKWKNE